MAIPRAANTIRNSPLNGATMPVHSSIKSEFGQPEHLWKYPALGHVKRDESFRVVLLTGYGEGTVIYSSSPPSAWWVGSHRTDWDMTKVQPWYGDVTISSTR
jgi:hypothetical protein